MAKKMGAKKTKESDKPMVLMGRFDRKLGKGRMLTIPAEWSAGLGGRIVYVLPDCREKCLNIVPSVLMEKEMERLRKLTMKDAETLEALQVIGSAAERLEMDRWHRIRISDKLLKFAGIKDCVVLVGSIRVIKAWNPDVLGPDEPLDIEKLVAELAK